MKNKMLPIVKRPLIFKRSLKILFYYFIKVDNKNHLFYGVGDGTCLGRSRLTAIPCFVFVISSLQTKTLQPQLAPAEPTKTD